MGVQVLVLISWTLPFVLLCEGSGLGISVYVVLASSIFLDKLSEMRV